MSCMGTYQRLGNYIRLVDVRNTNLDITNLMGVNYQKFFMPSVANTNGVDLTKYKVVNHLQFACNFMHVGRDECLPIALNNVKEPVIVSPAYFTFEVIDKEIIDPNFLFLLFKRSIFDRYAWFFTDGDVRSGLDKSAFFNLKIPIPPIEEQRHLVAQYQAVENRIRNNERLIASLEATAQTIFRHYFVENIDSNNLPNGWRMGTIGEYCKEMKSGGTPSRNHNEYWDTNDYPWLKSGEVHNNVIINVEESISKAGLENSSAKMIPKGSVVMAMYGATAAQVAYLNCATTTNQACCNMICYHKEDAAYLYYHLLANQEDIKKLANGGAQENLSQELIAQQPILLFDDNEKKAMFVPILDYQIVLYKENSKLTELQSLLLTKMGQY